MFTFVHIIHQKVVIVLRLQISTSAALQPIFWNIFWKTLTYFHLRHDTNIRPTSIPDAFLQLCDVLLPLSYWQRCVHCSWTTTGQHVEKLLTFILHLSVTIKNIIKGSLMELTVTHRNSQESTIKHLTIAANFYHTLPKSKKHRTLKWHQKEYTPED